MKKVNQRIYMIIALVVGIFLLIGCFFYFDKQSIQFIDDVVQVEINSQYDPMSFISDVKGYNMKDITVDNSQVQIDKLGEYKIIYKVQDKEYILKVNVSDTKCPVVETRNLEKYLNQEILIDEFIVKIEDQTQTKINYKEEYDFSKVGKQDIVIVVEDEGNNITEKTVQLTIKKDTEKPTLTGLKNITVYKGEKPNYLSGVKAKDNFDTDPQITVDSSHVNTNELGTYKIIYTVTDKAGNKNSYEKTVNVLEKKPVAVVKPSGNKTVYLTFDDGPSLNTAKILDTLAKYNAKATFFVTGNSQKYNYLIKRAHDEGHTIALHTYSHNYNQLYASVDAYFKDLDKIGGMVEGLIGYRPKYIRFPGGSSNAVSKQYCKGIMTTLTREVQARGYQYYDWNVSTGDASSKPASVNTIVKNATSSKANNIMILGHDTAAKNNTAAALPQIIEHYQSLGYMFKGIDDKAFTPHHKVNN